MAIDIAKSYLRQEYFEKKRTTIDIAKELNIAVNTVRNKILKFNIPMRGRTESYNINISKKFWEKYNKDIHIVKADPIDSILINKMDGELQELITKMEPLEDLLTGMRLRYDVLMAKKKDILTINNSII